MKQLVVVLHQKPLAKELEKVATCGEQRWNAETLVNLGIILFYIMIMIMYFVYFDMNKE